jgi:pilus assembly protein CpaB
MQMRALIVLAIALVMGVAAVYLVQNLLERRAGQAEAPTPGGATRVVVAAADLGVGTRLTEDALTTAAWPKDNLPEGVFTTVQEVMGDSPPIVLKEIHRGEAVLAYKLSPHGARGGLTAKIPEDMRAITIPVSEVRGVAGFVRPGDHVDVMHTTSVAEPNDQSVTRVLLQDVLVLGIDQDASEKSDEPRVVNAVTLLVTPEQGQKLTLAQSVGTLTLLLRNEGDRSMARSGTMTVSDLKAPQAVVAPVEKEQHPTAGAVVEVIRGLNVGRQSVPE